MIYGSGIIFSPIKLFPLDKFLNGELFNQMYIFQISQCTSILLPQIISEMSKAMWAKIDVPLSSSQTENYYCLFTVVTSVDVEMLFQGSSHFSSLILLFFSFKIWLPKHWVDQKILLGFSIRCYRKTWTKTSHQHNTNHCFSTLCTNMTLFSKPKIFSFSMREQSHHERPRQEERFHRMTRLFH